MKLPRVPQRTTTGFSFSNVERAIQEGFARRQFGKAEIRQVLAFFGDPSQCVYCGSPDVRRWDHVVPVREGGETVLGNIVPRICLADGRVCPECVLLCQSSGGKNRSDAAAGPDHGVVKRSDARHGRRLIESEPACWPRPAEA